MFSFMGNSIRKIFLAALAILLLAGGGLFAVRWSRSHNPPSVENPGNSFRRPPPNTATSTGAAPHITYPLAEHVPPYIGEAVRELHADAVFLKTVPPETYAAHLAELARLDADLATNPGRTDLWMRVAYLKYNYDDYAGARDAYEYLNRIADGNSVPFYNLAVLYGYNLKQPALAIPKFKAAIRRDPQNISFQIGFADFYREVVHELPRAQEVLLQALERVPANVDVYSSLASLEVEMKNIPKAIGYYELALKQPSISPGPKQAIEIEIERLKKLLPPS